MYIDPYGLAPKNCNYLYSFPSISFDSETKWGEWEPWKYFNHYTQGGVIGRNPIDVIGAALTCECYCKKRKPGKKTYKLEIKWTHYYWCENDCEGWEYKEESYDSYDLYNKKVWDIDQKSFGLGHVLFDYTCKQRCQNKCQSLNSL